jgi:predicted Rossmann fold nucleotide-binding protein DprA/Smf involved in DNA uptake
MALAYRTSLSSAELHRISLEEGPTASDFPPEVYAREVEDLRALEELEVRLVTLADPEYPERLRGYGAPLLLQVAGDVSLLEAEGVEFLAGYRGNEGRRLQEALERGDRVVVVLSKGMLSAKSLLRGLREPITDGSVALLSAEPPRAAWGPIRDRNRDALIRALTR